MPKTDSPAPEADAVLRQGTYHFLDMGETEYGDCIFIEFGDIRVLIDGSHIGDFKGQPGFQSVPQQLQKILGGAPPYDISLLIVTHCHADHIGCLPQLVANNVIKPKFALLTDPDLGFGRVNADGIDGFADQSGDDLQRKLAAALREEDASGMDDAALEAFIDAVEKAETRYANMITDLTAKGVKIVRYTGGPLPAALTKLMKPTGMKLLGPSRRQLDLCAAQIGKSNQDASDMADRLQADGVSVASLYRQTDSLLDSGGGGRGDGMNCQSITLAFGGVKDRVLLAGDMQFADPGVKDADAEVLALRQKVAAHGPYKLFKTTHHSADNGQDDALLTELGNPPLIVHSGGRDDDKHPNRDVLKMLEARKNGIKFWRTDRNGLITVRPHLFPATGAVEAKGTPNDFTPNPKRDGQRPQPEPVTPSATPVPIVVAQPLAGPQVIIVNLPPQPVSMNVGGVAISIDSIGSAPSLITSPNTAIETKSANGPDRIKLGRLAGGRELPHLLFATVSGRLAQNIGSAEAQAALDMIKAAGKRLIDLTPGRELSEIQAALRDDEDIKGVVLVGGYDVIPSLATDAIGPELRAAFDSDGDEDPDRFIVWSDDRYGDRTGDRFPDVPVSRIPDARDSGLVLAALQAGSPKAGERFGIRNVARPFADAIWDVVDGTRALHVSEEFVSDHVNPDTLNGSLNYLMLHGRDDDGRKFEGEFEGEKGVYPVALETGSVPQQMTGLAFAGCCWGALVVSEKACDFRGGPHEPRIVERSIALSYLKAGASAFVGCTGAHYSGSGVTEDDNAALVFHGFFWLYAKANGYAAAPSLFEARRDFFEFINKKAPSLDPRAVAFMLKNRTQFTCLGLGW